MFLAVSVRQLHYIITRSSICQQLFSFFYKIPHQKEQGTYFLYTLLWKERLSNAYRFIFLVRSQMHQAMAIPPAIPSAHRKVWLPYSSASLVLPSASALIQ